MEGNTKLSLAPRNTFSQEDTITLLVGPDEMPLVVHESQLVDSDFFKVVMMKEWAEGQTRTVKLPEESPEELAQYLGWKYFGHLPTDIYDGNSAPSDGTKDEAYELLASLYVVGENLLDTSFRNALIIEIIRLTCLEDEDGFRDYPGMIPANIIYAGTSQHSPARRLVVDISLRWGGQHWHTRAINQEFLFDFMQAVFGKLNPQQEVSQWRRLALRAEDYFV